MDGIVLIRDTKSYDEAVRLVLCSLLKANRIQRVTLVQI